MALRNRVITFFTFVILLIGGIYVILQETAIDALPDLSENQVIVMTQRPWQSPINVEDQVTYPITVNMQWLVGVKDIRAMSQIGLSMITIIFKDNIDTYFARDRVAERLNVIKSQLPPWVMPMLGPDATWLGQIYMYTLESKTHSLTQLRSIQDFQVKYLLQTVPWVAEIASVWGYEKTFQIIVDPQKLSQFNMPLSMLMTSIKGASNNISANTLSSDGKETIIQWLWTLDNTAEIENVVIGKKSEWTPLLIKDVATVRIGWAFRRWILADQTQEKVWGIVVMRYGANTLQVIDSIKEQLPNIQKTLPAWVTIKSFYDRTSLIKGAIKTLQGVLVQEVIITIVVLGLFLRHIGATLITAFSLVMAMVLTFLFMRLFNIPSNIMSLGGIAIAIGTMIDAAIVIGENIYQHMIWKQITHRKQRVPIIKKAILEVGQPVVFAICIIILSFIPIFSLQGMEGKLFKPLAFTNMFAMFAALITALFLVPALMVFGMKGKVYQDDDITLLARIQKKYNILLTAALKRKKITLSLTWWLVLVWWVLAGTLGSEFMPPLDEWAIMYMPMTIPDVSEPAVIEYLIQTNKILSQFPEVEQVVGKAWRAQTAIDPAPLSMIETIITLKPKKERRKGMTKNKLIVKMNKAIRLENLWNGFTQPIIGRIEMLSTGLKGDVGIKIFGNNHQKLEELAIKVEELMNQIPGASGVVALRTAWLQYLNIDLQDQLLAKYGIDKTQALATIAAWVGGITLTSTIDGRERYNIELRINQQYRQSVDNIKSLSLMGKNGSMVTLDNIAKITLDDGPSVIASENAVMRSAVQMNVIGRDLVWFVDEAKEVLEANLELPTGYFIKWAGQYNNQLRAKKTLSLVVPSVVILILFILYLTYKDIKLVSIVSITIPLSLIGWIIALVIWWFNFSVAVRIWFISLFGNAVETWMVIMVYLENAFREQFNIPLKDKKQDEESDWEQNTPIPVTKHGIQQAVFQWAMRRLRPVLMTAFTSVLWLLPMIITTGIGSEIQKPLAVVVIGWLTTSIFLTLIVLPILFTLVKEKQYKLI